MLVTGKRFATAVNECRPLAALAVLLLILSPAHNILKCEN